VGLGPQAQALCMPGVDRAGAPRCGDGDIGLLRPGDATPRPGRAALAEQPLLGFLTLALAAVHALTELPVVRPTVGVSDS